MNKFTAKLWAALLVAAAMGGTALAQSPDPYQPEATPTTTDEAREQQQQQQQQQQPPAPTTVVVVPPSEQQKSFRERVGFSLSLGGGVTDFYDDTMRDTTGTGGSWALRATVGTKTVLGLEASYFGTAQSIEALGLDTDTMLVSNGLQGALRLNAAIGAPVTPFLFGGLAWTRYNLVNAGRNTSAVADSDDLLEIPVGIGVGGSWRGLGYDLRGEFRFATEEDLVPAIGSGRDTTDRAAMNRWGVNATIGFGF